MNLLGLQPKHGNGILFDHEYANNCITILKNDFVNTIDYYEQLLVEMKYTMKTIKIFCRILKYL